jgi:hypothetical protein
MAQEFHLKLITERAGGGDPIIRERRVPGPELTIGRAADSDIVLSDLTIDPKHAKMRFSGPGRVTLESVSGLSFKLGGRQVQRADVDVASHPVVEFGGYSLAFEAGPEGGAVVTVTQDADEHHATPKIFSLQSPVFGRRRMAWVFGLGILLVCLLTPLIFAGLLSRMQIHPDQQWSSGPLSKSHAFLESDCKSCHAHKFIAVRDEACLACHQAGLAAGAEAKVLALSKDQGSPFAPRLVTDHAAHAKLRKAAPLPDGFGPKVSAIIQRTFGHPTDRCASCHIEHTKPGSKPAGGDASAPLSDKPDLVVVQDCEACHSKLKMRLGKTELIDTPDWSRHPAFRPLIMTAAGPTPQFQRIALSRAPQERNGLTFPHRLHLDPLGGVARQALDLGKGRGYGAALECASCHHRDASGKGFQPIEMERDCGGCHSLAYTRVNGQLKDLPHGDLKGVADAFGMYSGPGSTGGSNRMRPGTIRPTTFPAGNVGGFRAAFSPGGTCFDCHTYGAPGAGDPASLKMVPVKLTAHYMPRGAFDHAVPEHGGPGPAKAGGYKCADCHKAAVSDRASDVLVPDIAKCAACHGQPTTRTAAASGGECVTCHSFHAPGKATSKPGHPPLETLRWTQMTAGRAAGA